MERDEDGAEGAEDVDEGSAMRTCGGSRVWRVRRREARERVAAMQRRTHHSVREEPCGEA